MDIILLMGLILSNGAFAMSEIALVAAKGSRLKKLAERNSAARLALQLKDNPTLFLSTIQIGITAISILSGVFGEAVLSLPLKNWLVSEGIEQELAGVLATGSVVVIITYCAIVVGELVPKRIAQNNAEHIAVLVAYPIHALALLAKPFVALLSVSTNALLILSRQQENSSDNVTEEDIVALVKEGSEVGAIEHQEQEMIGNLLQLNDRIATSLMTPRSEIQFLDVEQPIEVTLKSLRQTKHSVWPVCRGNLDDLLGTISSKALLDEYAGLSITKLVKLLRKPRFAPEAIRGLSLLTYMQQTSSEMTFLVDEYGDIQGVVTHYDLLEAIAGELGVAPEQSWAKHFSDNSWQLDALIPMAVLKNRLALEEIEGEKEEGFQTLNGFLTWLFGRVPKSGEKIHYQDWEFEVLDVRNNRITRVKARKVRLDESDGHDS